MSEPLKISGVVLPEREHRDVYVRDGRVSAEPVDEVRDLGTGWLVPGLVDAHCHIGLDENGSVGEAGQAAQARANRDAGALLLRDCGTVPDTRWIDDEEDLPRIVRCGRHIARSRRYTRGFAHEVEPELLVSQVQREARRGSWVKIIGDWIERGAGDLMPSWPRGIVRDAITAAHDLGARVTAHVFGQEALPSLLDAGIDCIEHGTGLDTTLIAQMADQQTAYVPTALQLNNFTEFARQADGKFPEFAAHLRDLHARRTDTVRAADDAGVAIYAGTDAGGVRPHGTIVDEINQLCAYGLPARTALGAGSWRAREWLGFSGSLCDGAEADFVVYDSDPVADPTVLHHPASVVLRGQVV